VASSAREAAAGADVVVAMVADDAASRALWMGDQGALAGATPRDGGAPVLIDSSTVTVGWSRELAAAAARAGCRFLDAPVTGSRMQAAAGELVFFVGGEAAALDVARPALSAMGRSIVHVGPHGSGALLKLVNNFMSGVQAASLAEALGVIERSGLDRDRALDALTTGSPGSPLVRVLAGRMAAPDYTPNFYLHLMAKDLSYAEAEGRAHGVRMTTASAALAVFRAAMERGDGDLDMSAVVEQFRGGGQPR
jgi:3-hydroxyisobutyrate dehydrogenase